MIRISSTSAHMLLAVYALERIVSKSKRKLFLTLSSTIKYSNKVSNTHYDTLEITSEATQSEIKEAYYKLSKQYHPDRNKAENAKKKFQNISEAYEVLKEHQSRKRYDRSILVKEKIARQSIRTVHQKPVSMYTAKVHPQNMKIYDFDEWYRQHYGYNLMRMRERKKEYSEYQKVNTEQQTDVNLIIISIFSMVFLYILLKIPTSFHTNKAGNKGIVTNRKYDSK